MEIDDEMVSVARDAAHIEMEVWTVRPSPIQGSGVVFVHDMRREELTGVQREAFAEYRCDKDMAASVIAQQAWRAGLEAAVALHNSRQKKETMQ